jgi:hypothetical protein
MSKMGSHNPFGHSKHKLWSKERLGVKLPIWLPTTKSQEFPQFPYVQVLHNITLKSSRQGLQLCFKLHLNQRFAHKVMSPQSRRSPSCQNFGSLGTKWHLGAGPVASHRVYYKGEATNFPQVQAMVSLVNPNLPVARLSTKSVPILH